MGFLTKVLGVFKGTRKATRVASPSSEKRRRAQQKASNAWKATARKKEEKKEHKEKLEKYRLNRGKAMAAKRIANREERVQAGLAKAPVANEYEQAFRKNVEALMQGKPASVKYPYEPRGAVRKTEKLRNATRKSKVRSLAANPANWETFTVTPSNKNQREAWGLRPRGVKKPASNEKLTQNNLNMWMYKELGM